jgi:NodT family efflux transporter outer membrane factor (OMF) lipoprotein
MIRLIIYGCFVALLAACSVGPEYVRPQAVTDMPVSFKEMPGWKVAMPQDDRLQEQWWLRYHDPQLNALEEHLLVSSQTLHQAEAQYRQAKALIQSAKAGYYPTVGIGASATRSQHSANASTSAKSSSSSPAWDFQLPVDLSWEIDLWGRIRRTVEASEATATASGNDLAAVRLSMQTALASSYFQLRALDAQKMLFDETVAAYRKLLELTRNRYQSGIVAKSDLLQAETQLKSTEAQAIDLDLQRSQLEHAIAVLVGVPASQFSLPRNALVELPPTVPAVVPSELLEKRPDIAAAERRMAAANAQIGVAKAAYFPTVRLSATGGLESSSITNWLTWPSRFWSVGPAVSQNLFDGGLRRAQNEQARAAYDATVAAYRQTVLTSFQEVEDNLAALRMLDAESQVQNQAVEAAQQTTAVVTNQYRAGIVGYLNVINAQTAELTNRKTALTLLGRRMTASVQLIKALGGGWQKDTEESKKTVKGMD